MVKLMPLELHDFDVFVTDASKEYAQDKIKSGNWQPEEAIEKARDEFQRLLPDGLLTKDQFLYSILDEKDNKKIGVLWVQIEIDSHRRRAFICDFIIEPPFRGQGYGSQALLALDDELSQMNVESVSLHVFAHNTIAVGLYEKMGYSTTNLYMRKNLPVHPENQ